MHGGQRAHDLQDDVAQLVPLRVKKLSSGLVNPLHGDKNWEEEVLDEAGYDVSWNARVLDLLGPHVILLSRIDSNVVLQAHGLHHVLAAVGLADGVRRLHAPGEYRIVEVHLALTDRRAAQCPLVESEAARRVASLTSFQDRHESLEHTS